jgi:hypothetical protein
MLEAKPGFIINCVNVLWLKIFICYRKAVTKNPQKGLAQTIFYRTENLITQSQNMDCLAQLSKFQEIWCTPRPTRDLQNLDFLPFC